MNLISRDPHKLDLALLIRNGYTIYDLNKVYKLDRFINDGLNLLDLSRISWSDLNCDPTMDEWKDPLGRNYKYCFISLTRFFKKIEMTPDSLSDFTDSIQSMVRIAYEESKMRFSNWYFVFYKNKFDFTRINNPSSYNLIIPNSAVGYTYIDSKNYDAMESYFNNEIKDYLLNQNAYKYILELR